jgi:hypothetical protein
MQIFSLRDSAGNAVITFEQQPRKLMHGLSLFIKPVVLSTVTACNAVEVPIITGPHGSGLQRALMQQMATHVNAFGTGSLYDDDDVQYELIGATFGPFTDYLLVTHCFSQPADLHDLKAKLRAQICDGQRLVDVSQLTAIDNLPASAGIVFERETDVVFDTTRYLPIDNVSQYGCINKFFKENYQTELMAGFMQRIGIVLNRTVESKESKLI